MIFTLFSQNSFAKCEVTLTGNDQMQFDLKKIEVPGSCKKFKINLKHSGKLTKQVMGHNVVISKTEDMTEITQKAMAVGIKGDYVPKDSKVLAASKLVGGGEHTTLSVDIGKFKKGEKYTFFCSFPGHYALMKGDFLIK
ncbi:MAG: azurin [Bdellovibrionaceae bacterium]|nr:azurin [Pseudobdellovibrionaceae bacterium]